MHRDSLLATVGARIRAIREHRGMSRRVLSERCGVSERFLAQLESGHGNISLSRFADVAEALAMSPADLLAGASGESHSSVLALLGVRGSGKSSVGVRLAERRGAEFVEVDQRIEQVASMSLGEIFAMHGETYYHRLGHDVIASLLRDGRPLVIATGGSVVNDSETYDLLKRRARTIWLRTRPEELWNRVIEQGDSRPMAKNPHAFAELKALLAAREPLYAAADQVVDTTGRTIDEVLDQVCAALA